MRNRRKIFPKGGPAKKKRENMDRTGRRACLTRTFGVRALRNEGELARSVHYEKNI